MRFFCQTTQTRLRPQKKQKTSSQCKTDKNMTLPRKFPKNKAILKKIQKTIQPTDGATYLTNRNPRNLEFLRIANKPLGYQLDKPGRCFWNK